MKGNPQVIDTLNRALTIELTAINQYFCQAKMCKNWGYRKLAAKHYEESIGEMKHAEKIIDRVLFLEGTPEIARYDVIRVGTDVKEQFENDLALELGGVKSYNALVDLCIRVRDHGTGEQAARGRPSSFSVSRGATSGCRGCSSCCAARGRRRYGCHPATARRMTLDWHWR